MGSTQIKTKFKKIGFILASILTPLVFAAPSYAALPYFKAYGGDVFSGGWFDSYPNACNPSDVNFQAPGTNGSLTNPNKGGILAFVNGALNGGSSSENAA